MTPRGPARLHSAVMLGPKHLLLYAAILVVIALVAFWAMRTRSRGSY